MGRINGTADNIVLVQKLFPVGSIWVGGKDAEGNLINPSELFGGTWELIDKEFAHTRWYTDNYTNIDNGVITQPDTHDYSAKITAATYVANGHQINLRATITTTAEIAKDENAKLFVINYKALGASRLPHTLQNGILGEDNLNNINAAWCTISNTGLVNTWETVCGEAIPSGLNLTICISMQFEPDYMLDEFCDKFYWKRTT